MLKLDYMLFCEDVIVDVQKRASLINTFDTINAEKFPAINHRFKVVFRLSSEARKSATQELKFRFILTDASKKELVRIEGQQEVVVKPDEGIASAVDLSGIVFEKPGKYYVKFFLNNKELAERMVKVNEQK